MELSLLLLPQSQRVCGAVTLTDVEVFMLLLCPDARRYALSRLNSHYSVAVASASQNAAYRSIGQQLNSDSGIVTATNSALAQSQAVKEKIGFDWWS
jgi:hypothetical protein